jgi:geranylgeranyl pyrophosphate synthase
MKCVRIYHVYSVNPFIISRYVVMSRIDDIEDGSELRRGHPAAHAIFGIPQTINAANYVYFVALERTLALKHPRVSLLLLHPQTID